MNTPATNRHRPPQPEDAQLRRLLSHIRPIFPEYYGHPRRCGKPGCRVIRIELVGRVCSGEVGVIFGREISRLVRCPAEVARVREFAAITPTLLIEAEGIDDPGDV